jgi:hypothetical protein
VLRDRLIARIRREGPLPFEEFLRVALYDPGEGYFATGPLRSVKEGDFLTSPEVSPLFGETIAHFVAAEAGRIGANPVDVLEVGAGSGSLLRPLLDALEVPSRVQGGEGLGGRPGAVGGAFIGGLGWRGDRGVLPWQFSYDLLRRRWGWIRNPHYS